jgi:hypothetical protein
MPKYSDEEILGTLAAAAEALGSLIDINVPKLLTGRGQDQGKKAAAKIQRAYGSVVAARMMLTMNTWDDPPNGGIDIHDLDH